MKLTRLFFISDSLDDLERFEKSLEQMDLQPPQMHLLTLDDQGAATHPELPQVASFTKRDVIRSTLIGAGVGLAAAVLVLVIAYLAGWTATAAGWMPFIFLAIVVLGFITWQGGLLGIQTPHVQLCKFDDALNQGRHVFFVDVEPEDAQALRAMADAQHPAIEIADEDVGASSWIVYSHYRVKRFFTHTFP